MNANNGVEIDNLLVDSLALAPIPFENKVFFLPQQENLQLINRFLFKLWGLKNVKSSVSR